MKYIKYIILLILISIITTGCSFIEAKKEKRIITKNAINYFSEKYNIKKRNIKIQYNNFYGSSAFCFNSCGPNKIDIIYKTKEYTIQYDLEHDFYGDNYQYEEIYNDLYIYLTKKMPYAKIKINSLEADVLLAPKKYNHDIINFMKNEIKKTYYEYSDLEHGYTWISIWVESKSKEEAKRIHEQYSETILSELENLEVSYRLTFSEHENFGGSDNAYYQYHVSNENFSFQDKIDNKMKHCRRREFLNGSCAEH